MHLRNRRVTAACGALLLLVTSVACDRASPANDGPASSAIRILNAVVPEPPADPAAAYIHIQNLSEHADRLVRVQSDAAKTVELHETRVSGSATTMVRIDTIELAARGDFTMQPGGYHLMLVDLTRPLHFGGEVALTLTFEHAGAIEVVARVVDGASIDAAPGAGTISGHSHQ